MHTVYFLTCILPCIFSYLYIALPPVPGHTDEALLSPRRLQSPAHLILTSCSCCSSNLHQRGTAHYRQGEQRWVPKGKLLHGAALAVASAGGPPCLGWQAVSETNCITSCHVWCSARFSLASPIRREGSDGSLGGFTELPNCLDHKLGLIVGKPSWHWGYLHSSLGDAHSP